MGELHLATGEVFLEEWENGVLKSQIEQIITEDQRNSFKNIEKKNSNHDKEESNLNEMDKHTIENMNEKEENAKNDMEPIKEISKEYEENTSEPKNNEENNMHSQMSEIDHNLIELESHLKNKYESTMESKFESKFESSAEKDLLSEVKSELKTLDGGGFDTLTLIEQIEMFNSLNSSFLNKNSTFFLTFNNFNKTFIVQDWTSDDVGEWLSIIGLNEYVDNFTKNHINGKILFDLTDKELKEDLEVVSIGHRKNFQKAVAHLKKFYAKNRLYSDSIKNKLIKFYEKHSHQLKMGKKDFHIFELKNDVIHEEKEEISYKESPAVKTLKHENSNSNNNQQSDEFQLDMYEEDAILHLPEKTKKSSKKKNHFMAERKSQEDLTISKKLSPIISKDSDPSTMKSIEEISKFGHNYFNDF